MKKRFIALFAVLLLLFSGCEGKSTGENAATDKTYTQISIEKAMEMMTYDDGHIIVDVRTYEEYNAGHIEGAVCIPNESITDEKPVMLPFDDQVILVYCRSGRRSKEAAQKLYDLGYKNVYEFGGIIDWTGETVKSEY